MKNNNDTFSIALICSIALHLLIIYFFIFGLPSLFEKLPEEQVIVFEMLPINDKPNVPTKIKQSEKAIENDDAKKVEQSKPKIQEEAKPIEKEEPIIKEEKPALPPKPIEPPKPLEEKKAEPIEPKVVEQKEIVKEKPKTEAQEKKKEDTPEKKKEVAPAKKPAEKKKKAPYNKSDLDSLLKNLEQSSEGTNVKSNKQARSEQNNELQESKGPYDDRLSLSTSETALIRQQIEKRWNIPIGAENIDQARVTLYIALNQDGSVKDVRIMNTICPNISASTCSALSDSALRAVWQASPLQGLDPKRYNTWKEFNFGFSPKHF